MISTTSATTTSMSTTSTSSRSNRRARLLAALACALCAAALIAAAPLAPAAPAASAASGAPAASGASGAIPGTTAARARVRVRTHPRAARTARSHGATVSAVLNTLAASGAITATQRASYLSAYVAAKRSYARIRGTRHTELGAVIANLQAIAASGLLSASRLPALILTLERNRAWWTTEPLLRNGERVSFPPSKIVWEYYAGQGLEIQWLGTFGAANGFYLSGHENSNLRRLLGEVIPLASERAGGIAWEYMFKFGGGKPPWTSGLSQGTAVQVLARAYSRFGEPAFLSAAKKALTIFQTAPPVGVRVETPAGAYYAQYTYAPSDRILNGFIQADVGLYDYAAISKDPLGLSLFTSGDAQARAMVPRYDTGAWSLYDQYEESSLAYHELLAEFLKHLCERTRKGPPFIETPPPTTTTPETGGTGAPPGGTTTSETTPAPAPPPQGIAGDDIYCTTATRFEEDLTTPPAIALLSRTLPTRARAGVRLSLSKIATVRLVVKRGGHVVWHNAATVRRGKPRLLWVTPSKAGAYSVTLTASDLAGNFQTATGTIRLAKGAKAH
jgi:D-glucuronyl C5-epimerase C-terminus